MTPIDTELRVEVALLLWLRKISRERLVRFCAMEHRLKGAGFPAPRPLRLE
jgi:hypothetical protein